VQSSSHFAATFFNEVIVGIRPLHTGRDEKEVCIQWVWTGCQSSVETELPGEE